MYDSTAKERSGVKIGWKLVPLKGGGEGGPMLKNFHFVFSLTLPLPTSID